MSKYVSTSFFDAWAGLSTLCYKTRSFRIGAATTAATQGVSDAGGIGCRNLTHGAMEVASIS